MDIPRRHQSITSHCFSPSKVTPATTGAESLWYDAVILAQFFPVAVFVVVEVKSTMRDVQGCKLTKTSCEQGGNLKGKAATPETDSVNSETAGDKSRDADE